MADVLRSALLTELGVAHAFNLRTGGVSTGPYTSFNLGRAVGDEPSAVERNHARFSAALGPAVTGIFEASQVHGPAVRAVLPGDDAAEVRQSEADALVTTMPGAAVGVRVADCIAVLFFDPGTGAVGAAHAGWRGVVSEVLPATVRALCGDGPSELRAAIFPHIRACCFEVGEEVAQPLRQAALAVGAAPAAIERSRPKPHVDLAAIARAQLLAAGLAAERIDDVGGCTRCEPERFFSFRRDGKHSGRHLAAIVARART